MKISKTIVLFTLLISILALAVVSQINPLTEIITSKNQVTSAINLEESKECATTFSEGVREIYGNCVYYFNYTSCLNTSGPNTACSLNQRQQNFTCKSQISVINNNTECKPIKFIVSTDKGATIQKKELDYSGWGVCVNSTENDCLAITCGTLQGGSARNGVFNGCDGGKSCQKFLFCEDKVNVLYKGSREDFVEYDSTFHLNKLALKEVGQ